MEKLIMNFKSKILITILILLGILFAVGLFKNIAYPLLWNDEAETAMFATRILEYGYPKVHDGKNILCLLQLPVEFGVKEGIDAYIGSVWGHFYFSTIGAFLAEKVNNIYIKTALLRIPFALIGLLGLIIMILSVISLYKKNLIAKLIFLVFFVFFELLSISLILHLKQVRYCSITIFLSACIIYTYINYRLFKKINPAIYILAMTLLLLLLFNTFMPAYFAFIISIGLYECLEFLKERQMKACISSTLPLFISLIPVILLLGFFETFRISSACTRLYNVNFNVQYRHLLTAILFFQKYEFLNLVLVIKVILVSMLLYFRRLRMIFSTAKGNSTLETRQKLWISNFLSIFFVIYIFVVSQVPLPVIFQRYFITLQPLLSIILLLDIFIIFELIFYIKPLGLKRGIVTIILFLICILLITNRFNKIEHIKNYIYELSHQYQGPLDFAIPYIKSQYDDPEQLIIATNYEECAYMYYLGSKVIVGCVGNNLEEDYKMRPDIIIFRKKWGYNPRMFDIFFQNGTWKKISFPVFDYPVNNIPELDGWLPHLYKTIIAENDDDRLDIYLRQ